jgi:hypothetical protein
MRLLPAVALALGLVSAQDALVDFDALGITPAEILATDPEVESLLAEYEAGLSQNQGPSMGLGRSSGMPASLMALFGGRQLPPGIQLAQFIVNGQFDTIGFLNALKQALVAQATPAPVVPQVATLPVAPATSNRPVASNNQSNDEFRNTSGGGGNRPTGNRPSSSVSSSSSDPGRVHTVGANNYNSCMLCEDETAANCALRSPTDCGENNHDGTQDTRVCQMTYRSVYRNGAVTTLFTGKCSQRESCINDMKQNFVGPTTVQQCKPLNRLNRRFNRSTCSMCQSLVNSVNGDNKLLPSASLIFAGLNLDTLQNDPQTYMTVDVTYPESNFLTNFGAYN